MHVSNNDSRIEINHLNELLMIYSLYKDSNIAKDALLFLKFSYFS